MEITDYHGRTWRVVHDPFLRFRESADGLADDEKLQVSIYPHQDLDDYLDTVIHEALHVLDWSKDHDWINHSAAEIKDLVIWALRHRGVL